MMTALTTLYGEDHLLSDRHIDYYRERARGGLGLMVTEQQGAHRNANGSFHAGCSAWEPESVPRFRKLAEAVHEFDARMFVQLYAPGVHDKGTMVVDQWRPLWGVSHVPSFVHNEMPMVMEDHHIRDIVEGYGDSATNVLDSGLDGVEIHAAHSYLLGQFLSPLYNKRDDRYGGSIENRARIVIEVAEEVRRRVGDRITVGARLSFDDFLEGGISTDQAEEQLEIFASSGLFDYFSIAGGGYHTLHISSGSMSVEPGFMIPFGARAKRIVGDRASIFIVGRIIELQLAEQVLAEGAADMVAMTRAHLADPQILKKTLEGREEERIRCVGANECLARLFDQREVICVVNPEMGREARWGEGSLRKVSSEGRKSVVVVGAGPAGLRVSSVLGRRGHAVTLIEEQDQPGGRLNLLKQLPTRGEWQVAIDDLLRIIRLAGVDVRMNTTATPELLQELAPDAVICATGSYYDMSGFTAVRPNRDSVPGIDQANVIDVETATRKALVKPDSLGSRVLIVDESGTYLPLGLAEILGRAGVQVEVISPRTSVGEDLLRSLEAGHLFPRLFQAGVVMTPQTFIDRIEGSEVTVSDVWAERPRTIAGVDHIVISLQRFPNDRLFRTVRDAHPEVHRLGDALAPRRLAAVIYEGEELGRAI